MCPENQADICRLEEEMEKEEVQFENGGDVEFIAYNDNCVFEK